MYRLIFIMLLLSNLTIAQFKISGKVVTKDDKPIEFAEIVLYNEKTIPVVNQLTDEKGEFIIEYNSGTYRLEIRKSERELYSKSIVLNENIDLQIIKVEESKTLGTVLITKKRDIIERKVDRLVFNVENTIKTAGGDAFDVLKITPGVRVQNQTVGIIGKGTVRVLIDDKLMELSSDELNNLLKSIPSENIKSIEVMTTPPAKYEALGNSGLINIRLKKAKKDSWNLALGTSYMRRSKDHIGAQTSNFMYNKNKLAFTSSLNYRNGGEIYNYQDFVYFPNQLWDNNQKFERKYKRTNAIVSAQYLATSKWTIGIQYLGNFNATNSNRPGNTTVYNNQTNSKESEISSVTMPVQRPNLNSINLFNDIKLDTLGKKMIVNIDYFNFSNKDERPYEGTLVENNQPTQYFKGINENTQKVNNFSTKLDFEFPTKWFDLSFGSKFSISKAKNNIYAFNSGLQNDPITNMPKELTQFDYDENIQAFYVSGNKKYKKFEIQLGMRVEATQTKGYTGNNNQTAKNNYEKLFPSLNISYNASDNSTFRFSYGKRIGRPIFSELNPNITYINPFWSIEGNPFLQPEFINNFELIYAYKKLETKLYHSIENSIFNQIALPNPDTQIVRLTYRNIYNVKRYGFTESFVFDKLNWWTSNSMFDINYLTSKTMNLSATGVNGLNSSFSTNNDFILNKDKTVIFNLNYTHNLIGTYGVERVKSSSSTSLSFQWLLMDKDLKITLKGEDVFRTDILKFNSTVNGVYRNSNYYFDSRYFQLAINYKLGNKKVRVEKRTTGNEDERRRTGN